MSAALVTRSTLLWRVCARAERGFGKRTDECQGCTPDEDEEAEVEESSIVAVARGGHASGGASGGSGSGSDGDDECDSAFGSSQSHSEWQP